MKGAVYSSRSALYAGLFANGVRRAEKGAECEFHSCQKGVFKHLAVFALDPEVSQVSGHVASAPRASL
jgi:hypothetical protein